MKTSTDLLTEEIYATVAKISVVQKRRTGKADSGLHSGRECDLRCLYNPIPYNKNDRRDPWTADFMSYRGTGQDAEMALLELKTKVDRALKDELEQARKKLEEDQAEVSAFASFISESEK